MPDAWRVSVSVTHFASLGALDCLPTCCALLVQNRSHVWCHAVTLARLKVSESHVCHWLCAHPALELSCSVDHCTRPVGMNHVLGPLRVSLLLQCSACAASASTAQCMFSNTYIPLSVSVHQPLCPGVVMDPLECCGWSTMRRLPTLSRRVDTACPFVHAAVGGMYGECMDQWRARGCMECTARHPCFLSGVGEGLCVLFCFVLWLCCARNGCA